MNTESSSIYTLGVKARAGGPCRKLTCCDCAVFKAPCLDVSSAGMGRLHASSILGSILLLFCRPPGCRLHNCAYGDGGRDTV